jgi:tRNA nucleotidyltransferase (CCA-adding enzyme)
MKIYLVGGAVRDKLLGLPIKEKDWVVVNATVQEMLALGYRQVGKEFPVFLHPKTGEEYALARMERKVKLGYQGFSFDASPDISLEEDLLRRDLTINAMAEAEDGKLIDPYHGRDDLKAKLLRHVSPAFAEDPVRILRVGRFLARYASLGFSLAPETISLMKNMVQAGEVNALVAERVWKELERALSEKNPEKFFAALAACSALPILFPDIQMDEAGIKALIAAAKLTNKSAICFAALLHTLDTKQIAALSLRYRIPNHFKDLANLTALHHAKALSSKKLPAESILKLFNSMDVYRREPRFLDFLIACKAIADMNNTAFDMQWLHEGVKAVKSVNVPALIAENLSGQALAIAIMEKRLGKIKEWLEGEKK